MLTRARGRLRKTIGDSFSRGDRRRINSMVSEDGKGDEEKKIKEE